MRSRKLCPADHLSLYNAVAQPVSNSSGRLPHTGDGGFRISPAGEGEQLEEERVDCAGHQLIAQLVVMGDLAFMTMDLYLRISGGHLNHFRTADFGLLRDLLRRILWDIVLERSTASLSEWGGWESWDSSVWRRKCFQRSCQRWGEGEMCMGKEDRARLCSVVLYPVKGWEDFSRYKLKYRKFYINIRKQIRYCDGAQTRKQVLERMWSSLFLETLKTWLGRVLSNLF